MASNLNLVSTRASCLPPLEAISKGFIRTLQALPAYSLYYDFDSLRALLIEYVKTNFTDWKDFLETTTGMLYIELLAYTACNLSFRSDFQHSQLYLDTVQDLNSLTRLMLLVGEKLKTPSPSQLMQIDQETLVTSLRISRSSSLAGAAVSIYPGTPVSVQTEFGMIQYEIFEVDDFGTVKFDALMDRTISPFVVINPGHLTSDPVPGEYRPDKPSSLFIAVEGKSYIDTFVSNGKPDQQFFLANFPVITDYANNNYRVSVRVQNVYGGAYDTSWKEVSSLIESEATDKHYEVEWDGSFKTRIKFGNNVFGMVPPAGSIIKVCYRVGGGAAKRVSTGALRGAISGIDDTGTVNLVFENLVPTIGGGSGDDLTKAKSQLPTRIRRQSRLVSGEDFSSYASDFPGIAKARAELLNNDATGNLVRIRLMQYTTTSEGFVRPSEGLNSTVSQNDLKVNYIESISFVQAGGLTKIQLLNPIGDIGSIAAERDPVDRTKFTYTCLVSANGISKRFKLLPSDNGASDPNSTTGAESWRIVRVENEDVTALFPVGTAVGLTALNVPNYMLKLPTGVPQQFQIYGVDISSFGTNAWPGSRDKWAVFQINNEFLQVAMDQGVESRLGSDACFKAFNILSRGYFGSAVTYHPAETRVFLEGIRSDLYRAISSIKVEPSEVLLLGGKLVPVYILLKVRLQSTTGTTELLTNLRISLEKHFNFNQAYWGFGAPLRISNILTTIESFSEVKSVTYEHATQYTTNIIDPNKPDYVPLVINEDIEGVPDDTVLGLNQWKEAIGTIDTVVSPGNPKYKYFLNEPLSELNYLPTLTLKDNGYSDFDALPRSGLLKVRGELIAYKTRSGNILGSVSRGIFGTGGSKPRLISPSVDNPLFIAPNVIITLTEESNAR